MLIRFSVSRLFAAILKFCTTREHGPSRTYDAKLAKKTNVRHLEMQIYDHSPRVIVMDMQSLLTFDNNRIFDIFFFILCCTEVPRLVETCLWQVKPEHVLAI